MIRPLTQFLRIAVGALFIFSGLVKLNDPSGFAIKLDEYFHVFSEDAAVTQPDIILKLKKNTDEVAVKKITLHSSDNSRPLNINSGVEANETDSMGNPLDYMETVNVLLDKKIVLSHSTVVNDTISARTYGLIVLVDETPIYQKSFTNGQLNSSEESVNLNVKKYIKENSFLVGFFAGLTKYSLWFSLLFCALEVILGFALIIGWKTKLVSWLMFLLVVFFTFLTAYSFYAGYCPKSFAYIGFILVLLLSIFVFIKKNSSIFSKLLIGLAVVLFGFVGLCWSTDMCFACQFNASKMKVTDCGCFGDFLKLKPWESFYKDLVLTLFIGFILVNAEVIKPWFSKKFGNRLVAVFSILTLSFGVFCYFYLPIWDFLPYKKGNNVKHIIEHVPQGERTQDSIQITFALRKGSDSVRVPSSDMMEYMDKGYTFVPDSRQDELIAEGYKSPIHDFTFTRNSDEEDITSQILNGNDYILIWVCSDIAKTSAADFEKIKPIQKWAKEKSLTFLTSTFTNPKVAKQILSQNGLEKEVYRCDQKTLLTMARYNSTLYLFKGPVVVNKWSANWLPSTKKLEKICKTK